MQQHCRSSWIWGGLSLLMQHLKTCYGYQDFIDRGITADKEATEEHVHSAYVKAITSNVK